MNRSQLTRHAIHTGIAALTLDWLYTVVFWLILGRPDRRKLRSPYAEFAYFAVVAQLAVEIAAIVHLLRLLRKAEKS